MYTYLDFGVLQAGVSGQNWTPNRAFALHVLADSFTHLFPHKQPQPIKLSHTHYIYYMWCVRVSGAPDRSHNRQRETTREVIS